MPARPNVGLLRQVLDVFEEHPQLWWTGPEHRAVTAAGTAHGFAAWAVIVHGGVLVEDTQGAWTIPRADDDLNGMATADIRGLAVVSTFDYAHSVLGVTFAQADDLFRVVKDLGGLRRRVDEICEGADV